MKVVLVTLGVLLSGANVAAVDMQPNLTSMGLVSILFNGLQSHGHQQLLRSGKLPEQQVDEAKMAWGELVNSASSSDQDNVVEFLDATIKALEALDVDELATIADDGTQNSLAPSTESSGAREKLSTAILRTLVLALKEQSNADECSINYATYPKHPEFPTTDLSGLMKMMDGFPPNNQIRQEKISAIATATEEIKLAEKAAARNVEVAESKEVAYESCFGDDGFPEPMHAMENWEKDTEFARQFMSGANPVLLKVAKDPIRQLSKNMVKHFGEKKLQELADKKQLFFVSYDDLAELEVNPHQAYPLPMNKSSGPNGSQASQNEPRYTYAPIVTFVYDFSKDEMDVLGIQLERTDDAPVYTKNTSGKNLWLFVKSQVANADSNMHQWVNHLGETHLTMEPHVIAIYNTLSKANHPLYTFLKPLCRDTLLINWTGRETLVSFEALAWGDYQSSVGVGQAMQLIGKMWSRYSFFEKTSLPDELASRGFTEDIKMPAYLYREDGMKLWNAIGDFAKDFVDEIYNSDQAVAADTHIQDWAKETTDADKGAIPGFPTSFEDKETVIKVLQTLMWLSSGLHAAVNFGFYDYYAYVPNKPLNVRADMSTIPKDDEQIREWMFEHMFPHVRSNDTWLRDSSRTGQDATIDIISMAQLLNLPSDHCLDNLSDEFATIGKEAYGTFLKRLNAISDGINARNEEAKKANKATYNYLNPTVVPASIDI